MSRLLLRWIINAVAIWLAAYLVEGVGVVDTVPGLLFVALVFGLVNALIRPVVNMLTCLLNFVTLGLFTFVINALMLMLTGYLTSGQLRLEGFFPALWAGVIISIVSTVLSWFLPDRDDKRKQDRRR